MTAEALLKSITLVRVGQGRYRLRFGNLKVWITRQQILDRAAFEEAYFKQTGFLIPLPKRGYDAWAKRLFARIRTAEADSVMQDSIVAGVLDTLPHATDRQSVTTGSYVVYGEKLAVCSVALLQIIRKTVENGRYVNRNHVASTLRGLGWTESAMRIDGQLTRVWVRPMRKDELASFLRRRAEEPESVWVSTTTSHGPTNEYELLEIE